MHKRRKMLFSEKENGFSKAMLFCLLFLDLADQITKFLAVKNLEIFDPVYVFSFFNLTLIYNWGAAFGMFSHDGEWTRWILIAFGLLAIFILSIWIQSLNVSLRLQRASLTLILAGSIGNTLDRIIYTHVVDFVDLHYHDYHWPIFNLADTWIVLGVLGVFWSIFTGVSRSKGLA